MDPASRRRPTESFEFEPHLRLMTTQEKSSLTGPEIFMVVFSHEEKDDSVKK